MNRRILTLAGASLLLCQTAFGQLVLKKPDVVKASGEVATESKSTEWETVIIPARFTPADDLSNLLRVVFQSDERVVSSADRRSNDGA